MKEMIISVYKTFSKMELEKEIPKTKQTIFDKDFKINLKVTPITSELIVTEKKIVKKCINYKSELYKNECNIIIVQTDINCFLTINKKLIEEILYKL